MWLAWLGILCSALAALFFSIIAFAVRDFSRARLEDALRSYRRSQWLESIVKHREELVFVTLLGRLIANLCVVLFALRIFHAPGRELWIQYLAAGLLASAIGIVFALSLPLVIARYAAESMIALSVRFLHGLRLALLPLTKLVDVFEAFVLHFAGRPSEAEPEQIEKDILSVVEEGEKEGVVDTQERRIIESVIEFRDTQAVQIMTPRPEVVALELNASLDEVKRTLEESGHSRVPVYDGTLDHIVGVLYARDLLRHLGDPSGKFDMRLAVRPPLFVPETKPLRDLLYEFRIQKVHIAIVLDEYGGTAGLITIEDILEELVGEISDEHEPHEAMLHRINDTTFEADARIYLDQINRTCGLNLPEDQGFDTLGGFITTTLGRIPEKGEFLERNGARYTVLDSEPQRVKRLRIELLPQQAVHAHHAEST